MRVLASLALVSLVLGAVGCEHKSWSQHAKDQRAKARPTVPYIVNPKSEAPLVNLWRDAERSDKLPTHRVQKGTKCKIVDSKDLDLSRGGTMYLVQASTGEQGWIPNFCLEYRHK